MSSSPAYLDLGGVVARPASYGTCIQRPCPNCGVAEFKLCINSLTGKPRKAPCWQRLNPNKNGDAN